MIKKIHFISKKIAYVIFLELKGFLLKMSRHLSDINQATETTGIA